MLYSSIPNSPETEFVSLVPTFAPVETAKLNDVREFLVNIEALPAPKVTWMKDGVVLGDVAAEFTTSLQKIGETRLDVWDARDLTQHVRF